MSKNNPGRRSKRPFAKIDRQMLESSEWRDLSSIACKIFLELAREAWLRDGANGSVRRLARDCHCGRNQAAKALRDLEAAGLIRCVNKGGLGGSRERRASTWEVAGLSRQGYPPLPFPKFESRHRSGDMPPHQKKRSLAPKQGQNGIPPDPGDSKKKDQRHVSGSRSSEKRGGDVTDPATLLDLARLTRGLRAKKAANLIGMTRARFKSLCVPSFRDSDNWTRYCPLIVEQYRGKV
ncbi:MAG: helix-turn-helix domain-containing protein [Planctomycetota bacterium]|jgi:hypothetical protein